MAADANSFTRLFDRDTRQPQSIFSHCREQGKIPGIALLVTQFTCLGQQFLRRVRLRFERGNFCAEVGSLRLHKRLQPGLCLLQLQRTCRLSLPRRGKLPLAHAPHTQQHQQKQSQGRRRHPNGIEADFLRYQEIDLLAHAVLFMNRSAAPRAKK